MLSEKTRQGVTKIDYTKQALGLHRSSIQDNLFQSQWCIYCAAPGEWPKLHLQSRTRTCISDLFIFFVYNLKKYPSKCTDLKGGTKVGQKSFVISDVFTMVMTYLTILHFLKKCLTSSTAPSPFLFHPPYLLPRMTEIYHLYFGSTLTCINIWLV